MRKVIKIFLLFVLVLAEIQQSSNANTNNLGLYQKIYVFGDSILDTGNYFILTNGLIPPSVNPHATYYQGRFSNGPVAVEYLWTILNFGNAAQLKPSLGVTNIHEEIAVNFAYGGANSGNVQNNTQGGVFVPGVEYQVNNFIQAYGTPVPQRALYVIWTGANDYLYEGLSNDTSTINNIRQSIQALYSAGARNILVLNLPDLGSLPSISDPNLQYPPGTSTALTSLTLQHNSDLASALHRIRSKSPGIKLIYVDVFTLVKRLGKYLKTGMGPGGDCLYINPDFCTNVSYAAPNYIYWDVEHPTTDVHKLIALEMLQKLFLQ